MLVYSFLRTYTTSGNQKKTYETIFLKQCCNNTTSLRLVIWLCLVRVLGKQIYACTS